MWKGGRNFYERHIVKIFVVMLLWNAIGAYWLLHYFRQMHDSWTGTVVRIYDADSTFTWVSGGAFGMPRRYWEVRTSSGEIRTVRLYSWPWQQARPGDAIIKQQGQIEPSAAPRPGSIGAGPA
jgi:hypothetical protein